ncbi:MAG: valine--tRNA ligase [Bacteroidia bacterium]
MDISAKYSPQQIESKWYNYWMEKGFFRSVPDDREPYTIVIPPPNVTGVLHMGHMLNNTIQDVLIRRARMHGKNACWVPGTDHASIATEAKVVAMLKDKGIEKKDLTREEFLKYAWEWKEKYGGIILEQLKKLGASCDWQRTRFTMEDDLSDAVINVFIDLYKKGHIYRGVRMINWDPKGLTAISDEEVIYKEVNSKLVYVKYKIEGSENDFITIATTRPETILGDTAVCVHPNDSRYQHLKGKKAIVPIANRVVPIIFDEYIDMEFGTGALKVTPAHDINDYNLGIKHKLPIIDTLNPDGTISEVAGFYVGQDRFTVRKQIVKDLEALGQIEKIEDIKNKVGFSERTDAVIEPRLSMQWFLKMDKISKPALENVLNGNIKLIPEKFINTYKHWMENVHDWCISRQLWWGQRIPAWYAPDGSYVVAKTAEEAIKEFNVQTPNFKFSINDLKQDEDVLDTWFSSWLWPISVFDGFKNPDNPDIKYYYPTNDLVTAPEILFFWVARMIIAGYEYRNEKPFSNVYLTGIVRDKLGRKMSKSLGNSPDPLELIEKYGADGVRVGMLLCSPAGNDLPFDESLCEQGRNFANKIWNAFRLVKSWEIDDSKTPSEASKTAVKWFEAKFNEQLEIINDNYSKYRISEALMTTYKLVWDDFCSWYLEIIKPDFIEGKAQPIAKETYDKTIFFFENLLKILHPFMPFITEEIWHLIKQRNDNECLIVSKWPNIENFDKNILEKFDTLFQLVATVRNFRNQKGISPKEKLEIFQFSHKVDNYSETDPIAIKLCNLSKYAYTNSKIDGAYTFLIKTMEFFIPLNGNIDKASEIERLNKELEYNKGFLESVLKKLNNEKFISSAPQKVIEIERKKQADAEAKIKAIEEQLMILK